MMLRSCCYCCYCAQAVCRLTHLLLRKTFFEHFCAGETSQDACVKLGFSLPELNQVATISFGQCTTRLSVTFSLLLPFLNASLATASHSPWHVTIAQS